ncbi:hypothetical protein BU25DRAFT_149641 [Macroventuria anomochaeta]|uniref:Uncharacterized protein n=1 Tax=Macroventuria anomochaeta TaxID=301207 RepID=A0ACB6SDP7_9PLEO|nr:uncharacterized protein BU25DRAFT_149641 [Macroventuria anomochaeta]KAF2632341.1 hypothetical protein BU25DRAFT_149641 [Macroventuria anomochaeta]
MTAFVSKFFHLLTNYSEKQDQTLCTGCHAMRNRLFDPQPLRIGRVPHAQPVQRAERLIIHQNYPELSKCADTICGLCKFVRRELCFYSYDNVHYAFSNEDLQNLESDVHVWFLELYDELRETEDRGFEFCHGAHIGGPARSLHDFYLFQKPNLRKPREGGTDLESLFNLSLQWLATCRTMHQGCGPQDRTESAYLPTRLLGVG